MSNFKTHIFSMLLVVLVSLFVLHPLKINAQENNEILISNIQIDTSDSALYVSASIENLFTRKIVSTIQSGLTSVVHIQLELLGQSTQSKNLLSNERVLYNTEIVRTITYNIWDEQYEIQTIDGQLVEYDLDAAKKAMTQIFKFPVKPNSNLSIDQDYTLRMRVQITPVSAAEGQQLQDMLANPNRDTDILDDRQSQGRIKLSAGRIASFLVGKQQTTQNLSRWFLSKAFRIKE